MRIFIPGVLFVSSVIMLLLASFTDAFTADLAVPGRKTDTGDVRVYTPPDDYKPPEFCLRNGKNGYPDQTLVPDRTCVAGLRWKTLK